MNKCDFLDSEFLSFFHSWFCFIGHISWKMRVGSTWKNTLKNGRKFQWFPFENVNSQSNPGIVDWLWWIHTWIQNRYENSFVTNLLDISTHLWTTFILRIFRQIQKKAFQLLHEAENVKKWSHVGKIYSYVGIDFFPFIRTFFLFDTLEKKTSPVSHMTYILFVINPYVEWSRKWRQVFERMKKS